MNKVSRKIFEKLHYSYDCLYEKTGRQPNCFLLSQDVYDQLLQQEMILYELNTNSIGIKYINGIDILIVNGKKVVKAAIIDEK